VNDHSIFSNDILGRASIQKDAEMHSRRSLMMGEGLEELGFQDKVFQVGTAFEDSCKRKVILYEDVDVRPRFTHGIRSLTSVGFTGMENVSFTARSVGFAFMFVVFLRFILLFH
jgi:hypothetical protein